MIKLAVAVGFLSVFGFVAYVVCVTLIHALKPKQGEEKSHIDHQTPNKPNA
jgi:hypothetical protein